MRTVKIGIALIFVLFLASCGGTKEVIVPEHISAGSVQTDKGMPFYERGCYARALDHFYRANELYTAIGDSRGMAMSANNIGVVYRAMGEAAAAIPFFEDALRMYRSLGNQEDVRQTLSNLAAAQVDTGDYAVGREEHRRGAEDPHRAQTLRPGHDGEGDSPCEAGRCQGGRGDVQRGPR